MADATPYWQDDMVVFLIGCSFSFEEALIKEGIDVRHITMGRNVPMFRTKVMTEPAGPFHALGGEHEAYDTGKCPESQ